MRTRHSIQHILNRKGKWLTVRVERRAIPRPVVKTAPLSDLVAPVPMQPETLRRLGGSIVDEVAYLLRNQPLRMPGTLWRPDA